MIIDVWNTATQYQATPLIVETGYSKSLQPVNRHEFCTITFLPDIAFYINALYIKDKIDEILEKVFEMGNVEVCR